MKVIHTIEHESFCYPSTPSVSDTLRFELWDDGDVVIVSAEEDVIISLSDLVLHCDALASAFKKHELQKLEVVK